MRHFSRGPEKRTARPSPEAMIQSVVGLLDLALTVAAGAVILSWVSDVTKLEACRGGRPNRGRKGDGGGGGGAPGGVPWKTSYLASVATLEMILALGLYMTPETVPLSVVVGTDIVNVATAVVLLSLDRETKSKGGCLDDAEAGDWRVKGYTAFACAGAALLAIKVFLSALAADFAGVSR